MLRASLSPAPAATSSANAAVLRGDQISQRAGIETRVVDTVGAGDAFTAALALGLAGGGDLDTINRTACRVAAFVCSQSGATPRLPGELVELSHADT